MPLAVDIGARTYSVTQVRAFRECPAKWWYQWVLGHKPPPSDAMSAGSQAHEALARYYVSGEKPEGVLAGACVDFPYQQRWVEQRWSMSGPDHSLVVGVADLVVRDDDGGWLVVDHKTTSAPKVATYIQESDMLQLGVYAHVILSAVADDTIRVAHNCVSLRTGAHAYLERTLDRAYCTRVWDSLCADIRKMEAMSDPVRNFDSCGLWGGCSVMGVCSADRVVCVGEAP